MKSEKICLSQLAEAHKHKSKGNCRLVLVYVGLFWSLFDSGVGQKLQLFSIVLPNCALDIPQPICSHFFIIPAQYPARDPRPADGEWWLDLQLPWQLFQLIWALPPPHMVFKTLKCQQYHWFPNERCPVLDDLGSPFRSSVLRGPHFEVTWKYASQPSPWSIPDPWHRKTHQGLLPCGAKEGPCSLQDLQDEVDQSGNPQVAKCLGTWSFCSFGTVERAGATYRLAFWIIWIVWCVGYDFLTKI